MKTLTTFVELESAIRGWLRIVSTSWTRFFQDLGVAQTDRLDGHTRKMRPNETEISQGRVSWQTVLLTGGGRVGTGHSITFWLVCVAESAR